MKDKEYLAAIATMILISVVSIILVINLIFNL